MQTIYLDPTPGLVKIGAMFGYHGRSYKVTVSERVTCNSHWDGGSRDYYKVLAANGEQVTIPQNGTMFDHIATPVVELTPGIIVAEHSIFCGKDMGITLYIHASVLPKFLPSPAVDDLSRNERIVLDAMGFKSSYRRQECARQGINATEYDTAIADLKTRGYLSGNGALTTSGKNARQ